MPTKRNLPKKKNNKTPSPQKTKYLNLIPDNLLFEKDKLVEERQIQESEDYKSIEYTDRWKSLVKNKFPYIAKIKPMCMVDNETKRFIRNAADERAAQEGCKINLRRGEYAVNWVQNRCVLYEGSEAGKLITLDDWQLELYLQLFSWIKYSEERSCWLRRFKRASIWIPKKNAKSPTLASLGVYLLAGDGEIGQKCYSAARDGKQAEISHTHAVMMVKYSDILSRECKINATTKTILHKPTNSEYKVVTGENKKSTEGFNGNLLVDETHVVSYELMKRLSRMGISRKEPLHIEMSTSGDTLDSYGYSQYNNALKVINCETENEYDSETYALVFSIEQTLNVEKLRDKEYVEKACVSCNPTIGRIISKEEILSDWKRSSKNEKDLREFAMYRLNLWLSSAVTWISLQDWQACEKDYSLEDLKDYPCVAGLDLSKTRDMSALSLIFAVPDEEGRTCPYTYTWHWLPDNTAKGYAGYIDFYKYKDYELSIQQGSTIRYELICSRLDWIKENFDLRKLGFDPYNSDSLLIQLGNEYGWSPEDLIQVPQTMRLMGPSSKEFERLILQGRLIHNPNKLLDWQIGHCCVISDNNNNLRPVKPEVTSYKKIDGIVSLIIGLATFMNEPTIQSGYEPFFTLFGTESET